MKLTREKAYYKVARIYHYIIEVGEEIIPTVDEETNIRIYEKNICLKNLNQRKMIILRKKKLQRKK